MAIITLVFVAVGVGLAWVIKSVATTMLVVGSLAFLWLVVVLIWQSNYRFQQILFDSEHDTINAAPLLLMSVNNSGVLTQCSGRALESIGMSDLILVGKSVQGLFEGSTEWLEELDRALSGERRLCYLPLRGYFFRHHFQPFFDSAGRVKGVHCISIDLSRERQLQERLHLLWKIFANTADAIVVTDHRRVIQSCNRAFTEITGFQDVDVLGTRLGIPQYGHQGIGFARKVWRDLKKKGVWEGDIWNKRKNGEIYSAHMTIKHVTKQSGEVSNYLAFFTDITSYKRSQEKLQYLANHDSLTGLPNRRLFLDRLDQAVKRAKRESDRVGLYFIDLDDFKQINDSMGHAAGDALLKGVASRLKSVVRETDTVSRLAGDEFTIIVESVGNSNEVRQIAEKVLTVFDRPFLVQEEDLRISASVGVGVFPDDGTDLLSLMKGADDAMYKAKSEGRNGYYYLTPKDTASAQSELFDSNDLFKALERSQLALVFQPLVNIETTQVIGCEALIRWDHHHRGIVLPKHFIPHAERSGFIHDLGAWSIMSACEKIKDWQQQDVYRGWISVNVSSTEFRSPDFPKRVMRALESTGIPVNMLVLEIQEKVILSDLDTSQKIMQELAGLGVTLSIDNFGAGNAPYSYLKSLPVSILKVDQNLLRDVRGGRYHDAMLRAVYGIGDAFGLTVVAEGIERTVQEEYVQSLGGKYAQGFLYGKPMTAESFTRQVRKY